MKKQILSALLVIAVMITGVPAVLAENAPQVLTIPVVPRGTEVAESEGVSLMANSFTDPLYIYGVYTDNFYSDTAVGDTFNILVEFDSVLDARSKLTLKVIDSNEKTVATQNSAYYTDDGYALNYVMKLTAAIDEDESYSVEFTYTGSYSLEYDEYAAEIWPETYIAIKSAELIDADTNTWLISLANIESATTFSLCCYDLWSGEEYWSNAKCDANGKLTVTFGGEDFEEAVIYLCEEGTTDIYSCIDEFELEYGASAAGSVYESGVYTSDYIAESAEYIWLYLYEKSFAYIPYEESDLANVSAYMFDVTAKEKVGTLGEKEYYGDYGEIEGKITFTKDLDADHEYIIVIDDGYTIRTLDDFIITADPTITNVYFFVKDTDNSSVQPQHMPSGITSFYTHVSTVNVSSSERSKISAVLTDENGAVVATSSYVSSNKYKTTASKAITPGSYTMTVTCGDLTDVTKMTFSEAGSEVLWQNTISASILNGKTYIEAVLDSADIDVSKLTYKIVKADGTDVSASFYRSLYTEGDYQYFVVRVDSELTDVTWQDQGHLEIYSGNSLITPDYPDNMYFGASEYGSGMFVYDCINITGDNVQLFIEGETENATYTLCALDDATGEGKAVNLTLSSSKNTLTASKTALSAITTLYPVERDNVYYDEKCFYLERNGECVLDFYADIGNISVKDEFAFEKVATNIPYAAINLPWQTYDYYKLAATESALSSASWKAMETGVLYALPNAEGTTKLYGKFKTSAGTESAVYAISVTVDTIAPTLTVDFDETLSYSPDSSDRIRIPIICTASENGNLYYEIYDENNSRIGNRRGTNIYTGTEERNLNLYADNYDYTPARKLVIYMEDNAGNESEKLEFEIKIQERILITHRITGGTITFDPAEGLITKVSTTAAEVEIPEAINGYDVTSIGEYAFEECTNMTQLTIPASVTVIDYWAIDSAEGLTIIAPKDSEADYYAEDKGITLKYTEGIEIYETSWLSSGFYICVERVTSESLKIEMTALALYDADGNLKEIVTDLVAAATLEATFASADEGDIIKAFRWDSADGMQPIAILETPVE